MSPFLTMFSSEFLKKKNSLVRHFFERNLNLQSELQKNEFENLTSHRGKLTLIQNGNGQMKSYILQISFLHRKDPKVQESQGQRGNSIYILV